MRSIGPGRRTSSGTSTRTRTLPRSRSNTSSGSTAGSTAPGGAAARISLNWGRTESRRQASGANVAVDPPGDDHDRATARSYVDALVLGPDNTCGVRATGVYDDELVRTGDGWRIARRRFTMVLAQPVGDGGPG